MPRSRTPSGASVTLNKSARQYGRHSPPRTKSTERRASKVSKGKRTHEMVRISTQHTFASWMSDFPEENRPMIDRVIRKLGFEQGPDDINTIVRIYPIPEGAKQEDTLDPSTWLQTAGTAERLTVEYKRLEADGSYRQYVLGRPTAESESETSEIIQFGDHQVSVLPSEVLTAKDAVAIFQFYYEHDTVPPNWHLRNLPQYTVSSTGVIGEG